MRTSKDYKVARADKNGCYVQYSTTNSADGDSPRRLLSMVVDGNTNRQIASHLGIREDSVGAHLSTIFTKLGASCRAEAVAIAMRRHLLKL